jgi:hypothetical protein
MSRKNKVNPAQYKVAGRLSPDDLARERMKQNAPQDAIAWQERQGQLAWAGADSALSGVEAQVAGDKSVSGQAGRTAIAARRASRGGNRSAATGRPAKRSVKTRGAIKSGRSKTAAATKRVLKATAGKKMLAKARTTTKSMKSMRKSGDTKATKKR